jgi:hypothetical protein
MTQFGIDKLWLHTQAFSVGDADVLNVRTPRVKKGEEQSFRDNHYLFTDKLGEEIFGTAHVNTDLLNIDINRTGMRVNLNPSKVLHPYELHSVDALHEVEKRLYQELEKLKIGIELPYCNISRIDLAKQSETRQPCSNYLPLFQYLNMPRYQDKIEHENGFVWGGNKSTKQVVAYDKREEILQRLGIEIKGTYTRIEGRWKKQGGKNIGIKQFGDLKNVSDEVVRSIYNKQVGSIFRQKVGEQLAIDFPEELEYFQALKEQYPRGFLRQWRMESGDMLIMELFRTRSNLQSFFLSTNANREQAYRWAKEIELSAKKQANRVNAYGIADMLTEIKTTFLEL